MDACKVVKGLEPKFGYFVTKAAEAPKAPEKVEVTEEIKPEKAKKDRFTSWVHQGGDGLPTPKIERMERMKMNGSFLQVRKHSFPGADILGSFHLVQLQGWLEKPGSLFEY